MNSGLSSSGDDTIGFMKTWLGGNRFLKRALRPALPEIAAVKVTGAFRVFVDFHDLTGPSYYLLHGGAAAFYHYEEAEKGEVIQGLPSDGIFVDIGANIGLFSLFVARFFPQASIYAFEPHPRLYECLSKTIQTAGLRGLHAFQSCVSRKDGTIELLLNSKDSGGHTTRADQIKDSERKGALSVDAVSLDSFVGKNGIDRLDVMKVDVQGAEWDVLEGALGSIKRFSPKIIIEFDNRQICEAGASLDGVFESLSAQNYRVRRMRESESLPFRELSQYANRDLSRGILQTNYVLFKAVSR